MIQVVLWDNQSDLFHPIKVLVVKIEVLEVGKTSNLFSKG